jgi:hypothetical protein
VEYNKTGYWKNTEQMPSLLINKKIKDPEKVANVFNSFFLSIAENFN